MPELVLKSTGKPVYVADDALSDALASGLYEAPAAGQDVHVELRPGVVGKTTAGDLSAIEAGGAAVESGSSFRRRERAARIDREHGGALGTAATIVETGLDELTLGAFGAGMELLEGQDYTERRLERQEANPITHGVTKVGSIVGTALLTGGTSTTAQLARATPLGMATNLGTKIGRSGEGVGILSRATRVGMGGAVEGGATGLGQGVQELVASDDPLTAERIASTLSTRALEGAALGGAASLTVHGVGAALQRTKRVLDNAATQPANVTDELVEMDAKQLGAARKLELERIDTERATAKRDLLAARKTELDAIDAERVTTKKDLVAARKAELERIDAERVATKEQLAAARKTELDAIEQSRVAQRAEVADEIRAHRQTVRADKVWLATKGAEDPALRAITRRTLKTDRALDNLLDDPKALADNPRGALRQLRIQEAALDDLVTKHGDNLRAQFAADTSGTRMRSLEAAERALQRNRALQARIAELSTPPASPALTKIDEDIAGLGTMSRTSQRLDEIQTALDDLGTKGRVSTRLDEIQASLDDLSTKGRSSPRLDAIEAARDALAMGGGKSFAQQMTQGAVFSGVTSLVAGLAIPGAGMAAPILGGKVASFVTERLFGQMGQQVAQAAKRASKVVDAVLKGGEKVAPSAPVLATKVLAESKFVDEPAKPRRGVPVSKKATRGELAALFRERSSEIRSLTDYGADGRPKMRRGARARVAASLSPIAAVDPVLADRIESMQARKIEFLASRLPRRPDMGVIQTGADTWQPSDMEMRAWARYVAAVEDPAGIEERLLDGSLTPEDAEVMREVYPEMLADLTRQILEKLPELQESLPYERRLSLSILTGVPVDPAMHPQVLAVLQGTFTREGGTDGGVHGPIPQPQFGSVKNQEATPSQQREGVTA